MKSPRMKFWIGHTVRKHQTVIVCARSQVRARELLTTYLNGEITRTEFKEYWSEAKPGQTFYVVAVILARKGSMTPGAVGGVTDHGDIYVREGVWLREEGRYSTPAPSQFKELWEVR